MNLEVGGIYEIVSEHGTQYVIRIKDEKPDRYMVNIVEEGGNEYSGHIAKDGRLLKAGKITRLDKPLQELQELQQAYGDNKPKRRRTPVEIEIDNLIEHVQRNIKIDQLEKAINIALDTKNVGAFVMLSKEYAKLKKRVTA